VSRRFLVVTADDFGIGPATSQGILELAARNALSATVLLVNSPYAESAAAAWREAGRPIEVGWHPCLTLDRPVLPAAEVPSLVARDGRFFPLGRFLRRLMLGLIRRAEIERELRAQLRRFCDLVGEPPRIVNSHHHVQVFRPVGKILCDVLASDGFFPYFRRIREPRRMVVRIPGARLKRAVLSRLGRRCARLQARVGFPGNDWLAGITDPPWVGNPRFFRNWLEQIPGRLVELTCHPGKLDRTLLGRDCHLGDGQIERRVREYQLLADPSFKAACDRAGFELVSFDAIASAAAADLVAA
jgi:predicted glycoside hydrolase/deacetylase ChbG (UPF0249 family)